MPGACSSAGVGMCFCHRDTMLRGQRTEKRTLWLRQRLCNTATAKIGPTKKPSVARSRHQSLWLTLVMCRTAGAKTGPPRKPPVAKSRQKMALRPRGQSREIKTRQGLQRSHP